MSWNKIIPTPWRICIPLGVVIMIVLYIFYGSLASSLGLLVLLVGIEDFRKEKNKKQL